MSFRKLKAWFRRHRHGGKGRAATHRPGPAPAQPHMPQDGSGPAADAAGHPAAGKVLNKPDILPASGKKQADAARAKERDGTRPLSRQGIPILKPEEDLAAHFSAAASEDTAPHPASGTAGNRVEGKAGRPPRPAPPKAMPRNRVGIRRLDDDADLHAVFMPEGDAPPGAQASGAPENPAPKPGDRPRRVDIPTNRHGIPRLDNQADLQRLFDTTVDDTGDDQSLGERLRQSLAHDARGLMKKKTGGFFPPRRMSLKEKLRRYPQPQAQLDLHGATAARARERAASFIHTAQADGLYTLRIIVGKGRHSEGGPVLPDVIEDLLLELKRDDMVLSYRWEKRTKRKSGAVIVFLTIVFP